MLSRKERQAIAVAESIVAKHLKLDGSLVADHVNFRYSGHNPQWITVVLRTPKCHDIPLTEEFKVEVGFEPDEEHEFKARLIQGNTLQRCYYWDLSLPEVVIMETNEIF